MSKKRIHIDDLFRRGLGDMQLPVSGSDFAEMQHMLAGAQKRRRRRRAVLWLVTALLLLGGGTGGYMYYNNQYGAGQELVEQKTPVNEQLNGQAQQPDQQGSGISQEPGTTGNTNNSIDNTQSRGENIQPEESSPKHSDGNKPANRPERRKQKEQPSKQDNGQPEDGKTVTGNDKKEPSEEVITQPEQPINVATAPDTTTEKSTEKTAELPKDSAKEEIAKKEGKEKTKKPSVSNPFSISINAGPLLSTFGINDKTNYGRIRNQGDEAKGGLNAAITLNYRLSRWMFSAGLGVNSIRGGGNYKYSRQIWDSIPVLDPWGQIKGYFYTNYRDTALNFSLDHHFNYVTLPIFASYNMPVGNKWGLNLGAGVQVQYLAGLSGKYINPSNLFTFDLKNDGFIRKWNFAGSVNLGVYYNLNRYFTINTSMTYSHFINGMLHKSNGVGIRPRNMGLQIGLRYNFLKTAE